MRVLYFHQHFSTPRGSVGIRSYEMARRLLARGHEVTMVCGSYGGGETGLNVSFIRGCRRGQVDGINIVEFDLKYSNSDGFLKRSLTFLKFALRSIGLVFTERYDLLFATTTPLTAGIPGIIARWLRRKPFVFEVRDLWPELPKAMGVIRNPLVLWAMSALEWASYRSAHRLIGLSPGIVEGIVLRGVPRDRVTMIPNGCDLGIFAEAVTPWRPVQIGRDDLLAVFAGTHGLANGLEAVLAAAAELKRRRRSDIKLLLIGQGKLKADLQRQAVAQGLDNVVFHDPVNKSRLAGLMAATDLGMQVLANVPAFYYGTSPNKFFDYIAAGVPVLNNYPGWLAELITSHHCGYAVTPDNPQAFADALEHAADHWEGLRQMRQHARKLARSEFDRAALSSGWVDWLEGRWRRLVGFIAEKLENEHMVKRMMDVLVSGLALMLLGLPLLILAAVVRIRLGSPVLFRQVRPGLHGMPFMMIKFRTMTDQRGPNGEFLPDAQRLTRFGRLLRSTSLDELPELWNVLRGDMSLVGPRPLLMEYLPLYLPEQARRHEVRPGITGWAQVNGRNAVSWEERFRLDVWYVEHRSLWLDLRILWLTVCKVLVREGISAQGEATMPRFTGDKS